MPDWMAFYVVGKLESQRNSKAEFSTYPYSGLPHNQLAFTVEVVLKPRGAFTYSIAPRERGRGNSVCQIGKE